MFRSYNSMTSQEKTNVVVSSFKDLFGRSPENLSNVSDRNRASEEQIWKTMIDAIARTDAEFENETETEIPSETNKGDRDAIRGLIVLFCHPQGWCRPCMI